MRIISRPETTLTKRFQPERAALEGRVPPIVGAFVRAATDRFATECGASRPRIASPSSLHDATPPK